MGSKKERKPLIIIYGHYIQLYIVFPYSLCRGSSARPSLFLVDHVHSEQLGIVGVGAFRSTSNLDPWKFFIWLRVVVGSYAQVRSVTFVMYAVISQIYGQLFLKKLM